jgi:hypothetical protein
MYLLSGIFFCCETKLCPVLSELDLRRLDPDVAANLLAQIRAGADIQPILSQLRATLARDPASLR